MDLRVYYRKVRQIEEQIEGADAIVESRETPDGGKAGTLIEVPKRMAAKLVVEGKARLASAEQSEEYREGVRRAYQLARDKAESQRVRIAVIQEEDRKPKKSAPRGQKQNQS